MFCLFKLLFYVAALVENQCKKGQAFCLEISSCPNLFVCVNIMFFLQILIFMKFDVLED